MLARLWRLALVVALFAISIVAVRAVGSRSSAGAQLALTFRNRGADTASTVLIDVNYYLRPRLFHPTLRSNLRVAGWINPNQLMTASPLMQDTGLLNEISAYTIGEGWTNEVQELLTYHVKYRVPSSGWLGSTAYDYGTMLSPDGERVVFGRQLGPGNLWTIYILDRMGNLQIVASQQDQLVYAWRPCPEAGC